MTTEFCSVNFYNNLCRKKSVLKIYYQYGGIIRFLSEISLLIYVY